ncbi:MAG: dihydropteroate synthase, partial [Janthinobacterium lividum]
MRTAPGLHPLLIPGRTRVMGVLNVTPDSFSDGGLFLDHGSAITRGVALRDAGADLVDVGGESTRPGAVRVEAAEELRRVVPVVRGLVERGVPVSVDTMRAEVAAEAVRAGASVVNDVSGGSADAQMGRTVAELGCVYVLSHWRGFSDVMTSLADYGDVVTEVVAEIGDRLATVLDAGVARERVVLDPGLGFAKRAEHDWALLAALPRLAELGPLLVGA